jgi:hypothetical protein
VRAERAVRVEAVLLAAVLALAGCSASRIVDGVFHSDKGYRVTVPAPGWQAQTGRRVDLELRRDGAAGMLVDATCGPVAERSLDVLSRHLLFGLRHWRDATREPAQVGGLTAQRRTLRGEMDGREVAVEAIVAQGEGCVYDFLYVAPPELFDEGQPAFRSLVDSFARERAR